ncbi:MAG: hypothetical protein NVS2B16_18150 [Chloroflexota bacterium]
MYQMEQPDLVHSAEKKTCSVRVPLHLLDDVSRIAKTNYRSRQHEIAVALELYVSLHQQPE